MSDSFSVSNGVRQGSVLFPVLFAVYLDGLLSERAVVLAVIGGLTLWVQCAMQMTLLCSLHVRHL